MNFGLILCILGAAFLVPVEQAYGERLLGEFMFSAIMVVFTVLPLRGKISAPVDTRPKRLLPCWIAVKSTMPIR